MRYNCPVGGAPEEIRESVKRPGRAHPNKPVAFHFCPGAKIGRELFAYGAINSVSSYNDIRIGEFRKIVYVCLKMKVYTLFTTPLLQELEQHLSGASAKAVTGNANFFAVARHIKLIPIGKAVSYQLV
jgi:hypothetical protein